MEHPPVPPEQTTVNTPSLAQPGVQAPPSVPQYPLSSTERKRKLASKLLTIGAICLTAPIWGVFIVMATSDSAGSSSGAEAILPTIIAFTIAVIAPIAGIGLLVAGVVMRSQSKKLETATPVSSIPPASPQQPALPAPDTPQPPAKKS